MARAITDGVLSTVLATVIDGFIIIDQHGTIVSFNPAAERIFGYSEQEVVGQKINLLMPEPYHTHHHQYLTNYLTTGDKKIIGQGREIEARRKDGNTFPMEASVNEMVLEDQRYFLGTIKDISERKAREAALKTSLKYVDTLMNTVLDGLVTMTESGVIRSFNYAAQQMFGYHEHEVIGLKINALMPEPYRSRRAEYLQHYLHQSAEPVVGKGREIMAQRKNGEIFAMEVGVNDMVFEHERILVSTIRDISQRKQAEDAIQSFVKKLQISNEELDQFAYIASHDLKEPLRGLANNALFLHEDFAELLGEAGTRRIMRMRFLCERMEKLVDTLLYYSRLGRQALAVEATALDPMIDSILAMFETEAIDGTITFLRPQIMPTIVCDVPRTNELFRNLISNALKYNNKAHKTVEIGVCETLCPATGKAEPQTFYVKDNGMGISAEFHTDIFRIFKRLNEEDDTMRGTGVGLTFVKKIVERHGGAIWLNSTLGEGTCFYFTLKMEHQT